MSIQQQLFSPKQIAQALQASESSVKRWCDQGAISTVRTVGGHRKISLDALHDFLRTSNRMLTVPEALGLPQTERSARAEIPGGDDSDQKLFRTALAEGDDATCRRLLRKRVGLVGSSAEAADYLITDAMHGFGEAWDCSEIDSYQERRGCDSCIRLLNELRNELADLPKSAPVAIGGTLAGDPYQLPTAMVELSLREAGWNATSLGCGLPAESFIRAVDDCRPKLVWLSISSIGDVDAFISAQTRLAESLGDNVALLIGGQGLTEDVRKCLRYTAHCDSLRNLVDFAFMLRLNLG